MTCVGKYSDLKNYITVSLGRLSIIKKAKLNINLSSQPLALTNLSHKKTYINISN